MTVLMIIWTFFMIFSTLRMTKAFFSSKKTYMKNMNDSAKEIRNQGTKDLDILKKIILVATAFTALYYIILGSMMGGIMIYLASFMAVANIYESLSVGFKNVELVLQDKYENTGQGYLKSKFYFLAGLAMHIVFFVFLII